MNETQNHVEHQALRDVLSGTPAHFGTLGSDDAAPRLPQQFGAVDPSADMRDRNDGQCSPAPRNLPGGALLRREREVRQMTLEEASRITRIPVGSLAALEEDRYDDLPSDVFVRGFLRSYSHVLGLDPQPLLDRYQQVRHPAPIELSALLTPQHLADPRRKWGVGVALVLLLVLFTLVVSIALKPRQRGGPVELSANDSIAPRVPHGRILRSALSAGSAGLAGLAGLSGSTAGTVGAPESGPVA